MNTMPPDGRGAMVEVAAVAMEIGDARASIIVKPKQSEQSSQCGKVK
jgi:hypothetical protein